MFIITDFKSRRIRGVRSEAPENLKRPYAKIKCNMEGKNKMDANHRECV